MIEIDGSLGEGGGQVLRSALSLSLLTGKAFTMTNIRAARAKPGLRPQHLAAVQAAAQICHARVEGARLGAERIAFVPGPVLAGIYHFDIGTAGATALVLQTVLLPLALARGDSQLTITGGTHVPWSPCFHYLDWHWGYYLAHLGVKFELNMIKAGFYPQGGGEIQAKISGAAELKGMDIPQRGALLRVRGLSGVANLPVEIAERQRTQALKGLRNMLGRTATEIAIESFPATSKGTLLLLLAEFEHSQACFFALGERGKPAEQVADEAVASFSRFFRTDGVLDPWFADQILLPLAMAQGPSVLRTSEVTLHLLTNAEVIHYFLPANITVGGQLGKPALIAVSP